MDVPLRKRIKILKDAYEIALLSVSMCSHFISFFGFLCGACPIKKG
jgi:hypothetical protein